MSVSQTFIIIVLKYVLILFNAEKDCSHLAILTADVKPIWKILFDARAQAQVHPWGWYAPGVGTLWTSLQA